MCFKWHYYTVCDLITLQEMLRKSKQDDKGVKLEVNGRILDSCTDLMSVS